MFWRRALVMSLISRPCTPIRQILQPLNQQLHSTRVKFRESVPNRNHHPLAQYCFISFLSGFDIHLKKTVVSFSLHSVAGGRVSSSPQLRAIIERSNGNADNRRGSKSNMVAATCSSIYIQFLKPHEAICHSLFEQTPLRASLHNTYPFASSHIFYR